MPAAIATPPVLVSHLPEQLRHADYTAVHAWATEHPADFWEAVWEATTPHHARTYALARLGKRWFIGSKINLAAQVLEQGEWAGTALLFRNELIEEPIPFSRSEQYAQVAGMAAYLRDQRIGKGDKVGVYLPVTPEALFAVYAIWSIGAEVIFQGIRTAAATAAQTFAAAKIELLIAADGYRHAGKPVDRMPELEALQQAQPKLRRTVLFAYLNPDARWDRLCDTVMWLHTFNAAATTLDYRYVGFNHDAWQSGTDDGHNFEQGGFLLTALKYGLDFGVQPEQICLMGADTEAGRLLWAIRVQLCGGVPVLYDGAPDYPNAYVAWKMAKAAKAERVQLPAESLHVAEVELTSYQPLDSMRQLILTGAVSPATQEWVKRELPDVELHRIIWDDDRGQVSDWQAAAQTLLTGHRGDTPLE